MKIIPYLFATAFLIVYAFADDIALADGRVLKDAAIVSQAPRTVMIRHAGGLTSAAKTLLPPELQAKFPVDEAAAREANERAAEARAAAREQEQAEAARADRVRAQRAEMVAANEARDNQQQANEDRQYASARSEIERRARDWFKTEYKSPNNSTITLNWIVVIQDVEPVPGWAGRWRGTGRAKVEQYQSQGRTFTGQTCSFECELNQFGRNHTFVMTLK